MTNIDSPTAAGPRARLMYDAVVAAYINDISNGRHRPPKRRRERHRRPLARVLARETGAGRAGEQLAITASC